MRTHDFYAPGCGCNGPARILGQYVARGRVFDAWECEACGAIGHPAVNRRLDAVRDRLRESGALEELARQHHDHQRKGRGAVITDAQQCRDLAESIGEELRQVPRHADNLARINSLEGEREYYLRAAERIEAVERRFAAARAELISRCAVYGHRGK